MERLPSYENCFFCGRDSRGLHLRIDYSGSACSCSFVPDDEFQGFRGVLHGGIVSGILDEIMWWTVLMVTGAVSATVKMDLQFRRAIHCGETYKAVGTYRNARHRNHHVSASIEDASGKVCATAAGIFRGMKDGDDACAREDLFRHLDFSESSLQIESLLGSRLLDRSESPGAE